MDLSSHLSKTFFVNKARGNITVVVFYENILDFALLVAVLVMQLLIVED